MTSSSKTSDTPRTDAAQQAFYSTDVDVVGVEFARTLERENAKLRAIAEASLTEIDNLVREVRLIFKEKQGA